MTEPTVEYDLAEVLKGNIESIKAKLPSMSGAQLAGLLAMERADEKPRSTLIEAVEAVQDARAAEAAADAPAAGAGDETELDEEGEAELERIREETLAAQSAKIAAQEAEIGQLREQLAHAEGLLNKAGKTSRARDPRSVELKLDGKADVAAIDRVVFADATGHTIVTLTPLLFGEADFTVQEDGALVLDRPIAFPLFGDRAEIHAVWAVGRDGKRGLRSPLMAPLHVGGGQSAEIPAGHLRFAA